MLIWIINNFCFNLTSWKWQRWKRRWRHGRRRGRRRGGGRRRRRRRGGRRRRNSRQRHEHQRQHDEQRHQQPHQESAPHTRQNKLPFEGQQQQQQWAQRRWPISVTHIVQLSVQVELALVKHNQLNNEHKQRRLVGTVVVIRVLIGANRHNH